jgi:hypothetical protein
MKRTTGISFILLFAMSANTPLSACGDKLLHLSRIHRHHAVRAETTVAVFARPDSLLANTSAQDLEKHFREAGYRLLLVNNDRELALAVESGAADVVIADISDAPSVRRLSAATQPLVIPVIAKDFKGSDELRKYPAKIKWPAGPDRFLDALDRVTESKWEHKTATLQPVSSPAR